MPPGWKSAAATSTASLTIMWWVGVAAAALLVVWVSGLVAVLTNADRYRNANQLVWVLVVLLAGPIGAALYFALGRQRRSVEAAGPAGRAERSYAIGHPFDS